MSKHSHFFLVHPPSAVESDGEILYTQSHTFILGMQFAFKREYKKAKTYCMQALEDLEKASGRDHPDVATLLNTLAVIYAKERKYEEATDFLLEALSIYENPSRENDYHVGTVLNNLAVIYYKRRKYTEATYLVSRAIEIIKKVEDKDDSAIMTLSENLDVFEKRKCEDGYRFFHKSIRPGCQSKLKQD